MENEKRVNVLFIDDDELNARAFAKRLERRNFQVTVANNERPILDRLQEEKYDLILLDIVMPGIDGLTLLKQIRTQYSADVLPVIMITVVDDGSDIFEAFELGANDYITKSLNIDAAVARIKGHINASELHKTTIKLREVEAITALVVTYHHELNNPLAIIQSHFLSILDEHPEILESRKTQILGALARMRETLKELKTISEQKELTFSAYAKTSKMLKLKK